MSDKKQIKIKDIIRFVLKKAKAGSKIHIAMVAGVLLTAMLLVGLLIGAIAGGGSADEYIENEMDQSYDKDRESIDTEKLVDTILPLTEDAGIEYINGTLFIGDSNTVRSQLYGHTTWDNVVAAVSMGVQHINSLKMTYFKGYDEPVTVPKAVEIIQPQRIIITYGTNNTIGYTTEDFIKMYKEGLVSIRNAYPYADIIINSIPPIDKERENIAITMQTIDAMNKALSEMAKAEGYKFLNSAEVLKDEQTGFAKKDYTIGDGVHLSKLGMDAMFEYFRTHAYITEDTRPKPLKNVPEREETPTGVITEDPIAVRGTRIKIVFKPSDSTLGIVEGEVEQKLKRTITSYPVEALPVIENGGVFTGWSCKYEGLSSATEDKVTFKVPKVEEDVTEIVITANFEKVAVSIKADDKNTTALSLEKGKTKQLSASVTKAFKGDKTISWSSEDETVAKVDENGVVTAVSAGKTQIKASIMDGKFYTVCELTVNKSLEGIVISGDKTVVEGGTLQLKLNALPEGAVADMNSAVWSSSDETVATVSAGGKVKAVKAGTATITAVLGDFKATYTVTVTRPKPLQSISLQGKTELFEGEQTQLTVVYNPADTTDSKTAQWSSSDKDVATVTEGKVTANSAGTAEISCIVGQHTAKITIVVKQEPNYVKSVSISTSQLSLKEGESATVTAEAVLAFPDRPEGVDTSAGWSSAKGYVTVSDGVITAKTGLTSETGSLTDTVTVTIGDKTASCTVTITDLPVPPCAKCGESGHKADAHCSYCNGVNCTLTHCTKCGDTSHDASAHCPECGTLEHTQHPEENTADEQTQQSSTEE